METTSRSNPIHRPSSTAPRRAFTLVELLVVILIIAILIALLVPVIAGAIKSANAAKCVTDINQLATALTSFKSTYGDFPPSRILIHESGFYDCGSQGASTTSVASLYGDTRTDISVAALNQRSLRYLQKFFPRATVFTSIPQPNPPIPWPAGPAYDINQTDGMVNANTFMLTGDECLVFFLGGMPQFTTGSSGETVIGMQGFARDPSNPFNWQSTSRTQQTFQFLGGRLVDPDGDGFPSYLDTYGSANDVEARPYAFFASYSGGNYDPNDCNTLSVVDPFSFTHWVDPHGQDDAYARTFGVNFPQSSSSVTSCYPGATSLSPGPNPYTVSAPAFPSGLQRVVWHNSESFQIISAGADQLFGIGGSFSTSTNAGTLAYPDAGGYCPGSGSNGLGSRSAENDNLSNFYSARFQ